MFKALASIIAFLTRFPVPSENRNLIITAKNMYLFPIVGLFIGSSAGAFGYLISLFLPNVLVAPITLLFLYLITGFHHLDGLLDFGDGIMVQGTVQEKLAVMKDPKTGTGGLGLGFLVIITNVIALSSFKGFDLLYIIMASEVFSKFSMTVLAAVSKPASEGLGKIFIDNYRQGNTISKTLLSSMLTFITLFFLELKHYLIILSVSIIVSLILSAISNNQFKGVTGDVFGATNEFSRMAILVTAVGVIS